MRLYRTVALTLALTFLAVGITFLAAPHAVQALFDWIAHRIALPALPAGNVETGLFRALAVAYMYIVSLLAWMMFRRPAEVVWPTLLAHAKLASAALSFLLMAALGSNLLFAANGVVDGVIGLVALLLRGQARRIRETQPRPV